MENIIHSFAGSIDQRRIPDVTLDHVRAAGFESGRQIAPSATNEIVEYANFRRSCVKKLVNDGTPYKPSATGYQKPVLLKSDSSCLQVMCGLHCKRVIPGSENAKPVREILRRSHTPEHHE